MFSNETQTIKLPAITDKDPDETPVYKSVSFSDNGDEFMAFISDSKQIVVSPGNNKNNTGEFTVTIKIDDLRSFESVYRFKILIEYVEPPPKAK